MEIEERFKQMAVETRLLVKVLQICRGKDFMPWKDLRSEIVSHLEGHDVDASFLKPREVRRVVDNTGITSLESKYKKSKELVKIYQEREKDILSIIRKGIK